ncbi:DUF805 domain-containing protein [Neisseriaceae bacterium JH1-16]|nr:DUF805 domain-containing protein [Neisseriaceae bacterium JH1-16]
MVDFLFSFNGRISRSSYWVISLGVWFAIILMVLLMAGAQSKGLSLVGVFGPVFLVGFIISISASVRRFHDRNKSGWWYLIGFVPLIGSWWLLIENGFLKGTAGPNRYGPDPLAEASEPVVEH